MRLKRSFIIFLFTFAFIGISLVGLLVPYFSLENSYRETLTSFSFNINEVLNSENEDDIIAFYSNDREKDIVIFNGSGNVVKSTSEIAFDSNYLFKLKSNLDHVISFSNKNGGTGLATCSYNLNNNSYNLYIVYYDSSFIIFRILVIVIPIILLILGAFCVVFEYVKSKKEAAYLKYQVRKLRNIVNIQTMVEYDNDVENLANILKEQHLTRVAVLGYRSLNAEIAILACFFSRVAVVPLNPRYPHERCEKMMKTAQVDGLIVCPECATFAESFKLDSNLTLLTDKASAEHFSAIHNLKTKVVFDSFRDKLNTYEVPAFVEDRILYILFTSGSTGEPKAVAIPERCLASYSKKILTYYGFNQNDIIAQMADLTFDLSFHDLVSALLSGGCLVIIERKFLFTPALAIKKYEVTVFHAVPSVIGYMERFEHLKTDLLASLRICIFLGEALWYEQVEKLVPACPKAVIYNTYGPTESTVAVAAFKAYDPQSGIIYSKEEKLAVVPLGNVITIIFWKFLMIKGINFLMARLVKF